MAWTRDRASRRPVLPEGLRAGDRGWPVGETGFAFLRFGLFIVSLALLLLVVVTMFVVDSNAMLSVTLQLIRRSIARSLDVSNDVQPSIGRVRWRS